MLVIIFTDEETQAQKYVGVNLLPHMWGGTDSCPEFNKCEGGTTSSQVTLTTRVEKWMKAVSTFADPGEKLDISNSSRRF